MVFHSVLVQNSIPGLDSSKDYETHLLGSGMPLPCRATVAYRSYSSGRNRILNKRDFINQEIQKGALGQPRLHRFPKCWMVADSTHGCFPPQINLQARHREGPKAVGGKRR